MKLFYIHGFNSYKGSSTPKKLRQALGLEVIELCYRSEQPLDCILTDLRQQYLSQYHGQPSIITGTSMGGFFADQICDLPQVQAILLINPASQPEIELSQETFLGVQTNFITHESYEFTLETANSYKNRRDMRSLPVRRILLLAENDELLDSSIARDYWKSCSRIVNIEGGHRLSDFGTVARIIAGLIPEDEDFNERYAG